MAIPQPERRRPETKRKEHLDASVLPVEQALLSRAQEIKKEATAQGQLGGTPALARLEISEEFTKLAEELHFW